MNKPFLGLLLAGSIVAASAAGPASADPIASASKKKCHPNYKGACLKRNASDYDCAGGSGDGPYYVYKAVRIKGADPFRLDADGDGWGCE